MRGVAATRARLSITPSSSTGDPHRRHPRRYLSRANAAVSELQQVKCFDGAWYGPEIKSRAQEWIWVLSEEEVNEIDIALSAVKAKGLNDIVSFGPETFTLPTLGPKLVALGDELVSGRGFAHMRGLPVEKYSNWDVCAIFHGLGRYMGTAVPQNRAGHIVGHVKDLGRDPNDPLTRLYTTNAAQPYHTDSADIVGLLCLSQATSGGHSQVTSSVAIWNELVKRHPESAKVLLEPFVVSRKGEIPPGKQATYTIPIFHHTAEGRLCAIYDRSFIEAALKMADTPRLSEAQAQALDHLDTLACSDELRLDMTLAPGDIQWLHNHTTLHARSAFTNDDVKPRHLLRLWVSPPKGKAMTLPAIFAERFDTIEPGPLRGGIRVEGQTLCVPPEP